MYKEDISKTLIKWGIHENIEGLKLMMNGAYEIMWMH